MRVLLGGEWRPDAAPRRGGDAGGGCLHAAVDNEGTGEREMGERDSERDVTVEHGRFTRPDTVGIARLRERLRGVEEAERPQSWSG